MTVSVLLLLGAGLLGQVDAGPDPCDPRCDGDTLHFCDGETEVTLDCREIGARCTTLSDDWGPDCVLGSDAPCTAGYAFGASRCDPAPIDLGGGDSGRLYCIDGVCTAALAPQPPEPQSPTSGTEVGVTGQTTNPLGCLGCGSTQSALLVPVCAVFGARARWRRKAWIARS